MNFDELYGIAKHAPEQLEPRSDEVRALAVRGQILERALNWAHIESFNRFTEDGYPQVSIRLAVDLEHWSELVAVMG